jgi:hypothetical protein
MNEEQDLTKEEIVDIVLSEDFTGEFFTHGQRITPQVKEILSEYKRLKEIENG